MEIPALVVAEPQRAAYEPHVLLPAATDRSLVSDRENVRGPVREPHACARSRRLHHELGEISCWMIHRLVLRRNPTERRVVIGPVVQGGATSLACVQHGG